MTYIMCEHCQSLIPMKYWQVKDTQIKTIEEDVFGVKTTMQIAEVPCPLCNIENTLSEPEWFNCKHVESNDIQEQV